MQIKIVCECGNEEEVKLVDGYDNEIKGFYIYDFYGDNKIVCGKCEKEYYID